MATQRPDMIIDVIRNLDGGIAMERLSAQLQECVQASVDEHKVSEVTVKIKLKPGPGGQMHLTWSSSNKLPQPESATTVLWSTPENHLVTTDPHQRKLPFREVEDTEREVVDVENPHA